MTFVDESAKENCYALSWSFGEICCHCGCCSDDPVERIKARINYHEIELEKEENFDNWFFDDAELLQIQKENVVENIRYHRGKIEEYRQELEAMQTGREEMKSIYAANCRHYENTMCMLAGGEWEPCFGVYGCYEPKGSEDGNN